MTIGLSDSLFLFEVGYGKGSFSCNIITVDFFGYTLFRQKEKALKKGFYFSTHRSCIINYIKCYSVNNRGVSATNAVIIHSVSCTWYSGSIFAGAYWSYNLIKVLSLSH